MCIRIHQVLFCMSVLSWIIAWIKTSYRFLCYLYAFPRASALKSNQQIYISPEPGRRWSMLKQTGVDINTCPFQMGCQWTNHLLLFFSQLGLPYPEPVYTGWSSVHWNATRMPPVDPVYTGIPLGDPRILAGCTGTPLEKLSWNSPTLECHWRNLIETVPHWDATGQANFCSLHWNTIGGTATSHTRPGTYS